MEKCVNEFFIFNGKVKSSQEFRGDFISKGKSLYEVIRVIEGVPLFLEKHLERLRNSSNLANISINYSNEEIRNNIMNLIKANSINEGNIKIVFNFAEIEDYYMYFMPHHYPDRGDYINGVKTIFYHGERSNPNAKIIDASFRSKVNKEIEEKGVFEAILVDRNGFITEGSKSNIFMIKDDDVITSPVEAVLPGVTRNVIIEICKNLDINVIEKRISYNEVNELDAMFISGTSPKVLPISSVESVFINSSKNDMVIKIMNEYDKTVKDYIKFNLL